MTTTNDGPLTPLSMTASDYTDTLTGFDEIAIEKHMEFDFYEAAAAKRNVKLLRALAFVQATREGLTAPAAKERALGMTGAQLNDYFPDEPPADVDADQPDSESGKDGSAPAAPLTS